MGHALVEKILGQEAGTTVEPEIDLLMGHDATTALVIDSFDQRGLRVYDPSRVLIVFDHFAPPPSVEWANILNKTLGFVRKHELPHLLFKGICHQLLAEHPKVLPGKIVIGADSHTVTAGALGCFATGVGSTDFLSALTKGRLWLRVPTTIRVLLRGRMPAYIQGKDVILALLARLGDDGACYRCLEFHDETENGISMDNRLSISNMSVELGAKAAIFVPDAITKRYVLEKGGNWEPVLSDNTARYEATVLLDIGSLEPLVALPHGFTRIVPVKEVGAVRVSQVFIGSCTGGRPEDLAAAATIFRGNQVAPFVRAIVIPSSVQILQQAMTAGDIQTCIAAGATVSNPSCGPCGAIDKGILGEDDVCISTSSRNFQGRMGALGAAVYLSSTLTAATSALRGLITDPREVMA